MRFLALSGVGGAPEAAALAAALREHGEEVLESALEPGAGGRPARLARAMVSAEELVAARRPDAVVLCGEGSEIAAAALVAVKLGVPQARIRAGVRGGDRTDPDEIDRAVVDRVSDLLLCEDERASGNLAREGLGAAARVVGDVTANASPAASGLRSWLGSERPSR